MAESSSIHNLKRMLKIKLNYTGFKVVEPMMLSQLK